MNEMIFRGGGALPAAMADATHHEEAWLRGQPPIESYLEYIREMAVDGSAADARALVDEWRTANDHYHELEKAEAGLADRIKCRPLPRDLQPLASEVMADARFRRSFDSMPTTFEMVEIERLVLFQTHVSRHYVEALKKRLGPRPTPAELFRFCIPLEASPPPVKCRQLGSRRFSFTCDSLDFRFQEPVLLDPQQVRDYEAFGAISGIVAVMVGFSSNFLSAVRSDSRVVLHNGYHRAVALLELGIKLAPCIIETVTRRDELALIAKRRVADNPSFYLEAARPPLLKDFLDPRIRKVIATRKVARVVEVELEVRDHNVTE